MSRHHKLKASQSACTTKLLPSRAALAFDCHAIASYIVSASSHVPYIQAKQMVRSAVLEVRKLVQEEGGAGVADRRGMGGLAAVAADDAPGQPGTSSRPIRNAALQANARISKDAMGVRNWVPCKSWREL
jgi:hypothetical protein